MPAELRDALREVERRARRDRLRTALWRLRDRFRWRRGPMVPVLLLALAVAGWQAWRSWDAPGSSPRVIYGTPSTPPATAHMTLRVSAIDGDTLASGGVRLRLHAIDAPEMSQTCTRQGRPYACGEESRRAMARILGSGMVACEGRDTDQYGRRIARCTNDSGQDIAAALVAEGWAVAYRRFGEDYVAQENEARRARRGLWSGDFDAPEEYRRRQRP